MGAGSPELTELVFSFKNVFNYQDFREQVLPALAEYIEYPPGYFSDEALTLPPEAEDRTEELEDMLDNMGIPNMNGKGDFALEVGCQSVVVSLYGRFGDRVARVNLECPVRAVLVLTDEIKMQRKQMELEAQRAAGEELMKYVAPSTPVMVSPDVQATYERALHLLYEVNYPPMSSILSTSCRTNTFDVLCGSRWEWPTTLF